MAQNKTKRDNRAALFKMFDPYEGFAELLQKKTFSCRKKTCTKR